MLLRVSYQRTNQRTTRNTRTALKEVSSLRIGAVIRRRNMLIVDFTANTCPAIKARQKIILSSRYAEKPNGPAIKQKTRFLTASRLPINVSSAYNFECPFQLYKLRYAFIERKIMHCRFYVCLYVLLALRLTRSVANLCRIYFTLAGARICQIICSSCESFEPITAKPYGQSCSLANQKDMVFCAQLSDEVPNFISLSYGFWFNNHNVHLSFLVYLSSQPADGLKKQQTGTEDSLLFWFHKKRMIKNCAFSLRLRLVRKYNNQKVDCKFAK